MCVAVAQADCFQRVRQRAGSAESAPQAFQAHTRLGGGALLGGAAALLDRVEARIVVDALLRRRVVRRRHRRAALHLDVDRWAAISWRHLNQSGSSGAPAGPLAKAEDLVDEERQWVNGDGHIGVEQPRESSCKLEGKRHQGERPLEPARAWGAVRVAEPPSRSRYEHKGGEGPEGDEHWKQDEDDDQCALQSLRRRRRHACGGHEPISCRGH